MPPKKGPGERQGNGREILRGAVKKIAKIGRNWENFISHLGGTSRTLLFSLPVVMTAHPLPPTPGVTSRVTPVMKHISVWVASQFLYHIRESDFSMDKVNM